MAELSLTPTSYLVLGLVAGHGPCTSYEMKRVVGVSIGNFWPFPHSQLYAEPARLAEHGLLAEDQEEAGRRRRTYRITGAGTEALQDWLAEPADDHVELRDQGLLKLFFGALATSQDLRDLAAGQREAHEQAEDNYLRLRDELEGTATAAQLKTLDLGIRFERTCAEFWREVGDDPPAGRD